MKLLGVVFALIVGMVAMDNKASAIAITPQNYTYNFQGTCTVDCTGFATGALTLQNYAVGDFFSESNFVSFSYSSDFTQFVIASGDTSLAASGLINNLGQG